MKSIVIAAFCGLFAVANAGVGVLSRTEEEDALNLFRKLCASGREGGDFGGARVWCKAAPGEQLEIVNHQVEVPSPIIPDNVIFVQPQPITYKHNIAVQGSVGVAPRTKIYVLPQKSQHTIQSQYNPGSVVTIKPTVYFLKTNGEEGYRYGTPAPPGIAGYN